MRRRSYPKPPRNSGPDAPPEPPYKFQSVPNCTITADGLSGSILQRVTSREEWLEYTGELVGVSHEAGRRRADKTGVFRGIHHDHAELERLSYDFIAERAETDDPIRGYVIRTDDEARRMQGFCWYTTFTTWTHYFKWDTFSPLAGLTEMADAYGVRWDKDGSLSHELESSIRNGDPNREGVIWPRVAEVALVGALECGGFLVQLVLEEMEASDQFDYVVVQATESSAGFYDRMGFRRVGALAKYAVGEQDPDSVETVAYRHWTYPDEDINTLDSSIMMALRLRRGEITMRVLADKGGILPHIDAFSRGINGEVAPRGHNVTITKKATDKQQTSSPRRRHLCHPWLVNRNDTAKVDSPASTHTQHLRSHSGYSAAYALKPQVDSMAKRKRSLSSSPCTPPSKRLAVEASPPIRVSSKGRSITPSLRLQMSGVKWVSSPRVGSPSSRASSSEDVRHTPTAAARKRPPPMQRLFRPNPPTSEQSSAAASPVAAAALPTPPTDTRHTALPSRHASVCAHSSSQHAATSSRPSSRIAAVKSRLSNLRRGVRGSARSVPAAHTGMERARRNRLMGRKQAMSKVTPKSRPPPTVRNSISAADKMLAQNKENIAVQDGSVTVDEQAVEDVTLESSEATTPLEDMVAADLTSIESNKKRFKTRKCPFSSHRIPIRPKKLPHLAEGTPGAEAVAAALRWKTKLSDCTNGTARVCSLLSATQYEMLLNRGVVVEANTQASTFADVACGGCSRRDGDDRMILCDGCDAGWHLDCMDPPMECIPKGDWFCVACTSLRAKATKISPRSKAIQKKQGTVQAVLASGNRNASTSRRDAKQGKNVSAGTVLLCSRRRTKPVERFRARAVTSRA